MRPELPPPIPDPSPWLIFAVTARCVVWGVAAFWVVANLVGFWLIASRAQSAVQETSIAVMAGVNILAGLAVAVCIDGAARVVTRR